MNKLPSAASFTGSLSLFCCLSLSLTPLQAQNSTSTGYGQYQQGFTPVQLSPEALDQMVSPIALYPDALIALMLPAATTPSDIVLAARYLSAGGDPAQTENQSWDESVKGLLHYPDVLSWMDQNLDWTTSLGEAFATQPADVMNAIQTMRAQAQAQGNLVDTPQQKVVVENDSIRILPADPEIIYVPVYDPEVVYVQPYSPDYGSLISFGVGCSVGAWLCYDFDWGHRSFYHGNWNRWHGGGTTVVNVITINNNGASAWQPSANSLQQISQRQRNNGGNVRIATGITSHPATTSASAGGHAGFIPRPSRPQITTNPGNTRQTGMGGVTVTKSATGTIPAPVQQIQQQNFHSPQAILPRTAPPQIQQVQQEQQVGHIQKVQQGPFQSAQTQQFQQNKLRSLPSTQQEGQAASLHEAQLQQQAEAPRPAAAPEHHAAPPEVTHPRENAPQVIQAPKVEPQHHQEAPAPAPAPVASAQEAKEHKKGDPKDKPTP